MSTSLLLFIQHPCIDIPWLNFQMPQPSFPCPKRPYSILTTTRPGSEHGQHTSGTSSKPMSWSPMLEVILANMKNRKTCTSGYLYKSPHTQTKNNAVQVYYTYIYICMLYQDMILLYIFARGFQKKWFSIFCEALTSLFLAIFSLCLGANQLWIQFEQGNGSTSSNIQLLELRVSGYWT